MMEFRTPDRGQTVNVRFHRAKVLLHLLRRVLSGYGIPTQWNLQVYDSTGGRVPQRSSSLAETADILAAVPVFRQASSAQ
jgi:hypothetical protein